MLPGVRLCTRCDQFAHQEHPAIGQSVFRSIPPPSRRRAPTSIVTNAPSCNSEHIAHERHRRHRHCHRRVCVFRRRGLTRPPGLQKQCRSRRRPAHTETRPLIKSHPTIDRRAGEDTHAHTDQYTRIHRALLDHRVLCFSDLSPRRITRLSLAIPPHLARLPRSSVVPSLPPRVFVSSSRPTESTPSR